MLVALIPPFPHSVWSLLLSAVPWVGTGLQGCSSSEFTITADKNIEDCKRYNRDFLLVILSGGPIIKFLGFPEGKELVSEGFSH